jgi:hypothetical protein
MNVNRWALSVTLGLLLAGLSDRAAAQTIYQRPITNPYNTPVFSPYLNLVRGGTNSAINYYGLVRPEFQTLNALRTLRGDVNANAAAITQEQLNALPATGHQVQFLNTTHYFFNTTGAGSVSSAGLGAQTRPSFAVGSRPQQGAGAQKR